MDIIFRKITLVKMSFKNTRIERNSAIPVCLAGNRVRSNIMGNTRYINRLHWVFDLPHSAAFPFDENEAPRVMMNYERSTNVMEFEILDRKLPADVRKNISLWLQKSSHVWNVINGLV